MSESAKVGLETTGNTARGVFGPFPVDYVTESLFCHNGKHFCVHHNGSVPEILLLENIVILVQFPHPRVPGCSWSPCFPLGGK